MLESLIQGSGKTNTDNNPTIAIAIKETVNLGTLPISAFGSSMAYLDGYLYILPGWTVGGSFNYRFFRRHLETGITTELASCLVNTTAHTHLAVMDGKIYLTGGANTGSNTPTPTTSACRYDPFTDKWTSLSPLPRPRLRHTAFERNGELWLVGGRNGHQYIDKFDPVTNRWESAELLSPLKNVYQGNFVRLGDKLLVMGGYATSGSSIVEVATVNEVNLDTLEVVDVSTRYGLLSSRSGVVIGFGENIFFHPSVYGGTYNSKT